MFVRPPQWWEGLPGPLVPDTRLSSGEGRRGLPQPGQDREYPHTGEGVPPSRTGVQHPPPDRTVGNPSRDRRASDDMPWEVHLLRSHRTFLLKDHIKFHNEKTGD